MQYVDEEIRTTGEREIQEEVNVNYYSLSKVMDMEFVGHHKSVLYKCLPKCNPHFLFMPMSLPSLDEAPTSPSDSLIHPFLAMSLLEKLRQ